MMDDSNERQDVPMSNPLTLSPPSVKDDKTEGSDVFLSDTSHLDTEILPPDDHANCPLWHKSLRKPRVLDCLHSMCEDCIVAKLEGRKENIQGLCASTDFELEGPRITEKPPPTGVVRCPICSQETQVGNDVRYVRTMLLDYTRINPNEASRIERRCRTCKSEQVAVAFCKQCEADLCLNCLAAHGLMRMFEGHEAITYADLEMKDDRRDAKAVICPRHHHPFKVLCATCENLACKICLEIEHIHHKVIEVSDRVVLAIEQEIRSLISNLDNQWNKSLSEWTASPDQHAALHAQYEAAKGRLEINFERLAVSLEDAKQRKMKELEDARQKQENIIEDHYRKMNLNEVRVNDAIGFTKRLLDKASGMELLVSRKKVVHQLNNLSQTMPTLETQAHLEYNPLPKKQVDHQLNIICGEIIAHTGSSCNKPATLEQVPASLEQYDSSSDWSRLYGNAAANLPAIGTERKKVPRGSTDSFWFPNSNPPDVTSAPPQIGIKEMILSNPASSANMIPGAPSFPPISSTTGSSLYNNCQWPAPPNPAPPTATANSSTISLPALLAARQQLLALTQANGVNGNQTPAAAANALLMQQRLRAAALQQRQQRNDPVLSSLSSMSLDNYDSSATHISSSESLREPKLCELKTHSVFGTSQSGSSIRELHCPSGFCISKADDILIADTNNHRIVVCGPPAPWQIGSPGIQDGMLCFPRKVVALKGDIIRYVVLDKAMDAKTRVQLFDTRGQFLKRINITSIVPRGSIEVAAATSTSDGHLLLIDNDRTVFCIDVDADSSLYSFDVSSQLGEASDVAVNDNLVYITDFKNHCVEVFNTDGAYVRKLGEPSQTPYPIGIDISKNGDVFIADTHGNHLHVVVFSNEGQLIQSFTHNEFRLSRCVGLRIAGSGHLVTLCKHNHTLFVFKPLLIG